MKVLVIGGNGNIGGPVSSYLASKGDKDVTVLCRSKRESTENIRFIQGDANDRDYLIKLQEEEKFDVVINFLIMNTDQAKLNIDVFKGRVKQFVFISTATVFNREKAVVISEKNEKYNRNSGYAQVKLKCEELFLEAKEKEQFPITIVRPSQTYSGHRIPLSIKGKSCWTVISRILRDKPVIVHGDGTSTWVSTHSRDFAVAFEAVVGRESAVGEDYNIMGDEIVSWNMIYGILGQALDKEVKTVHIPTDILKESKRYDLKTAIEGDKQYSVVFDTSKIKSMIPGFECQIGIEKGLEDYLEYMDRNPGLKVEDPEFDEWCDSLIEGYTQLKNGLGEY